jgi:hypothetical protein
MSERLFIESINKLTPESLSQEIISGLYLLLNSDIDKNVKQSAYDKLNEWKSYKRKMAIINKNHQQEIKKETATAHI